MTRSLISAAETQEPLLPPLAGPLGAGWQCRYDVVLRVGEEEGKIDLLGLNPACGVALVAFIAEDEETSPEEAVAGWRAMLGEIGFGESFTGHLPVIAVPVPPSRRERLAETVREALAAQDPLTVPEEWAEWLGARLSPSAPAGENIAALLVSPQDEKPGEGETILPADAESSLGEVAERPMSSSFDSARPAWIVRGLAAASMLVLVLAAVEILARLGLRF